MVYLDDDYVVHLEQDEGTTRMPWNDPDGFFVGKCQAFVEGYRVVPENNAWQREDGVTFYGPMISPIITPTALMAAQAEADKSTISDLDAAVVDLTYQNILLEMGV